MNKTRSGFTVLELAIVIILAGIGVSLFFAQKVSIDAFARDEDRKTAINAMYYSLEEGFYAKNGYYPSTIFEDNLTTMDPNLFTDPSGININEEGSSYRYEPAGCDDDGKCSQYTLRATLEKEEDFVKRSRN